MDKLQFSFELKELADDGQFRGLASVYGNRDHGGDIVAPGAFTKTIQERGGRVPLMDGHRIRIGVANVKDSRIGLEAAGKINLDKQSGRDAYSDLKFYRDEGLPMGMSIGYQALQAEPSNTSRILKEIKLFEVTITETPQNDVARVFAVKSADDDDAAILIRALKDMRAFLAPSQYRG